MTSAVTKIATVTSGASSVIEFSAIPATYTDLFIVLVGRSTKATGAFYEAVYARFNSVSTSTYAYSYIYSDASAAQVDASASSGFMFACYVPTSNNTASVYSNGQIYIAEYANTSYQKTLAGSVVAENNNATAFISSSAGTWQTTNAAVNTISLITGSGSNWASGSYATLYGVQKKTSTAGSKATGGLVTTSGGYTYHTFRTSGNFLPTATFSGAEVLLVAGGGSGSSGGGGAGGLRYFSAQSFTSGTPVACIVGAGGAGVQGGNTGCAGFPSHYGSNSASGGGNGAGSNGASGGSGGGAGGSSSITYTGGAGNAGGYSPVEGFAGGSNGGWYSVPYASGGGGGAGAVGQTPPGAAYAGKGGIGVNTYSTWANATNTGDQGYYAGGGGGSTVVGGGYPQGGGAGGGGNGGINYIDVTSGQANTGGGGGGTPSGSTATPLPNGGSGIIIIRYAT